MRSSEFKMLVMPYSDRIYRMAYRFMGSREEAEDIVQEVYLKLWGLRKELNNYNSIEALSIRIARNLCLDKLRKRKTSQEAMKLELNKGEAYSETPFDSLERKEEKEVVLSLIAAARTTAVAGSPETHRRKGVRRNCRHGQYECKRNSRKHFEGQETDAGNVRKKLCVMESIEKVRKMLERFYQGETTLEEERWLQDYLSSTTVSEEFLADKELFIAFKGTEESISVPGDLNSKILETIDREEHRQLKSRRISLFSLSGLAAGLLALIAVYVFFLRTDNSVQLAEYQMVDTYEDPMDAYEEAKKTLAFVSNKLNAGTSEIKHMQQVSKSTTEPLRSLSKINKGSKELVLLGELQRVREISQ